MIRSFEGFAPPPRYDSLPWTKAELQESAERDAGYTTIETFTLVPDKDPANPAIRNFTTAKATLDPAWYRFIWKDAAAATSTSDPIYTPTPVAWRPTVAEVAAHLRARTKVPGGTEVGTFTEETRPTAGDVERLIDQAVRRVASSITYEPCSPGLETDAQGAAALYCAMLVEQSYYPETTTAGGSSFLSLNTLWKEQISTLVEAVAEECGIGIGVGGSGEGGGGGIAQMPAGAFYAPPMVAETAWNG